MEIFRYILLGVVQGLTEFLPISSSGHLVIFQKLLPGFDHSGILLEVVLHAGTILSVIYYFGKSISKKSLNYWILIGIATIPAALVGLIFNDQVESLFSSLRLTGVALLVTGVLNYYTSKITKKGSKLSVSKKWRGLKILTPLTIGLFQAFAIVPGISRSGSTIFTGRKLGLSRKSAAEFSFLMSIPAILGANIYEFFGKSGNSGQFTYLYIVGFIASFVSGVIAIRTVLHFLERANYKYFSYYALIVGLLVILIA